MPTCTDCGGTVIEYDSAAGNGFCVACGTVVEENTIVSEVTFGEASSGAAIVQGSYVGQGSTHARMGGPFGSRGASESREQTIANAGRKIRNVANAMRLSEVVSGYATRLYTLAVEIKFTKGRKNMNVIAACLYIACRKKETRNYMLIDFSDLLQVNVFELGHTFLQLIQALELSDSLPLVDPSHYISRFAALLEFGDETSKVAADAVRLVARMDRDWMTHGRRPAGICGACLLLAARMNSFRRSIAEIVQVVKIADTTLMKRLEEFRKTPSGKMTVADFRNVWLEDEMDPPAFTKGREKEAKKAERERISREGGDPDEGKEKGKEKGKKKSRKKRKRDEGEEYEQEILFGDDEQTPGAGPSGFPQDDTTERQTFNSHLLNEGIFEGSGGAPALFLPPPPENETNNANIDPALLSLSQPPPMSSDPVPIPPSSEVGIDSDPLEETANTVLTEEVTTFLNTSQGTQLSTALNDAESRRLAQIEPVDDLLGLDEEELDRFILSEDEVKVKERIWVEMNREYLEALAARMALGDRDDSKKSRKRRKPPQKPRDTSTPSGSTAAESVRNLLKKNPKYSKRINYDALKDLFEGDNAALFRTDGAVDIEEKEEYMYRMDEKSDGEGGLGPGSRMVVVEEGGGGVGHVQTQVNRRKKRGGAEGGKANVDTVPGGEEEDHPGDVSAGETLGDEDADGDDDLDVEMSDKGDEGDYGWDEGYEQEV